MKVSAFHTFRDEAYILPKYKVRPFFDFIETLSYACIQVKDK